MLGDRGREGGSCGISGYGLCMYGRYHTSSVHVLSGSSIPAFSVCLWFYQCCGSGSCYFRQWLSRSQQQINFCFKFFCLLLFEVTFTSFFKDKKTWRSHKTAGIKSRSSCDFCLMVEGSGSVTLTNGFGSGRPKNIRIQIRNTGFITTYVGTVAYEQYLKWLLITNF